MNASAQAVSISLTHKIANAAVMFRAEFPSAVPDLNPWLVDDITQQPMQPSSIDLSFVSQNTSGLLNCRCILLQVLFSDELLKPNCQLIGIDASGYDQQGQCWKLSTDTNWRFDGRKIPKDDYQHKRFIHLLEQILTLFQYPAALPQPV